MENKSGRRSSWLELELTVTTIKPVTVRSNLNYYMLENSPLSPDSRLFHMMIGCSQFLVIRTIRIVAPAHTLRDYLFLIVGDLAHATPELASCASAL
jgi:hypothetical protein